MAGRSHAVVIGASVAGLLAAAVLAERYDRVTVYDRDTLPDGAETRKGVPQSRQAHGILWRGTDTFDRLLPGFADDLTAAGAVSFDQQRDLITYLDGYLLRPAESGLIIRGVTRPTLEHLVRRRVLALDGVSAAAGTDVTGLTASGGRVTGVRVRPAGGDAAEDAVPVPADLVVDAAGRGSRAGNWLGELGYPAPEEEQVRAGVVYVTRYYAAAPGVLEGKAGVMTTPYPGRHRGGGVLRQEGDRFVVFLTGMVGDDPPVDDDGFLACAETLEPETAEVIRRCEPLGDAVKMRYPVSRRLRYDKLDRRLDGFLATGDAVCTFNPIYGQGMTAAALEALELRRILAAGPGIGDLTRRYLQSLGKLTSGPWTLSASGDLRFPAAEGRRHPADRFFLAYTDWYRAAASVDPELGRTFLRVANMLDSPLSLLAPARIAAVLRSAGKGRAARAGKRAGTAVKRAVR
ncbi:MAG: FAD-binding monooxygenase [Streptosporangiales bacterium]|nr:FAD-binding monooxygenase [Streptosporangiales bacterium]